MSYAELIESVDMLTRAVRDAGSYDWGMLTVTLLAGAATVAAVVVALRSARDAQEIAESAQAVARDAAESSRLSAAAAADMLELERLRLEDEYRRNRAEASEKLLAAVADYRALVPARDWMQWDEHARALIASRGSLDAARGALALAVHGDDIDFVDLLGPTIADALKLAGRGDPLTPLKDIEGIIVDWHRGGDRLDLTHELHRLRQNASAELARLNAD